MIIFLSIYLWSVGALPIEPFNARSRLATIDDRLATTSYWSYYEKYVKQPVIDRIVPDLNTTFIQPISSLIGGIPLSMMNPFSDRRFDTENKKSYPLPDPHYEEEQVVVASSSASSTPKLRLPIVNDFDSFEDFTTNSPPPQESQDNPLWPPEILTSSHPDRVYNFLSGKRKCTSTTSTTTKRPTTTSELNKQPLSGSISLGKFPISFGRPPFLPYPVAPIVAAKPVKVTNPYIMVGFNPEIKLPGMKIQKQFGIHMGIKIIRPQRKPYKPFSFLTPLIGGAMSPAAPPPNLIPFGEHLPHPFPPPGISPLRPFIPPVGQNSDIIIGKDQLSKSKAEAKL